MLSDARSAVTDSVAWYPYETLGNLGHMDVLLTGEYRDLDRLADGLPVADIGAADGDLAFVLERCFGWEVDIVDNAPTNMNGLRGAHLLRAALGSQVGIHDVDLDRQFHLPREHYGLVFFFGILYHLQNPFYALRQLAAQADHCLLSTKIARFAAQGGIEIGPVPVAYLLAPREANDDPTNFWVFSHAGLDRLAERTGWDVLARMYVGDVDASDPASADHDERAFMLLRSQRLGSA